MTRETKEEVPLLFTNEGSWLERNLFWISFDEAIDGGRTRHFFHDSLRYLCAWDKTAQEMVETQITHQLKRKSNY